MIRHDLKGLYAITPDIADTYQLCEMTQQALRAGVRYVQYRNKSADDCLRLTQAKALTALCRDFDAHMIINDRCDLAITVNADGVHLGKDDMMVSEARDYLGKNKIIGVSCYNQLKLAIGAEKQGADYVAFGAFFPSLTKTDTVKASTRLLFEAKNYLNIPIVAIGGITLENAAKLVNYGCDALAVCHALFNTQCIRSTAVSFNQLFTDIETISSS